MSHSETFRKQLSFALEKHLTINDVINDLRTFWVEVSELGCGPRYEEMSIRLDEFQKILSAHFLEEEQLFKKIEDVGDSSACDRVQCLRDEHAEFLERLVDDSERLNCNCESFSNWDWIHDEIDDLINRMAAHEAEENALIHQFLKSEKISKC